jgi:hypothetical protein
MIHWPVEHVSCRESEDRSPPYITAKFKRRRRTCARAQAMQGSGEHPSATGRVVSKIRASSGEDNVARLMKEASSVPNKKGATDSFPFEDTSRIRRVGPWRVRLHPRRQASRHEPHGAPAGGGP